MATAITQANFDWQYYLDNNPDVATAPASWFLSADNSVAGTVKENPNRAKIAWEHYAAQGTGRPARALLTDTTTELGLPTTGGPAIVAPATGFDITSLPIVGPIIGQVSHAVGVSPLVVTIVGGIGLAWAFGLLGGDEGGKRR